MFCLLVRFVTLHSAHFLFAIIVICVADNIDHWSWNTLCAPLSHTTHADYYYYYWMNIDESLKQRVVDKRCKRYFNFVACFHMVLLKIDVCFCLFIYLSSNFRSFIIYIIRINMKRFHLCQFSPILFISPSICLIRRRISYQSRFFLYHKNYTLASKHFISVFIPIKRWCGYLIA